MATLMTYHGSSGNRQCDAKCYDAKMPDCDCICGGANHGVGLDKAQSNVQEMGEELIKKFERRPVQKGLFDMLPLKKPKSPDVKIYQGTIKESDLSDYFHVTANGRVLSPTPSQKLRNHSPDGFAWGYSGSGPAQLALAILLDFTKDKELSQKYYQQFKSEVVAGFNKDGDWCITGAFIKQWINRTVHGAEQKAL